jgi:hypothetical protein
MDSWAHLPIATCPSIARTPLSTIDDFMDRLQEEANRWIAPAAAVAG